MLTDPVGWHDVVCAATRSSSPACDAVGILGLDDQVYRGRAGARIWDLVRQPILVSEIHRRIAEELGLDEETARRSVLDVLTRLREAALIEVRK